MKKRKESLGIRRLSSSNKALLCKWSWQFAFERQAIWRQVISGKYKEEGGWQSYDVRNGYGVKLWKLS